MSERLEDLVESLIEVRVKEDFKRLHQAIGRKADVTTQTSRTWIEPNGKMALAARTVDIGHFTVTNPTPPFKRAFNQPASAKMIRLPIEMLDTRGAVDSLRSLFGE